MEANLFINSWKQNNNGGIDSVDVLYNGAVAKMVPESSTPTPTGSGIKWFEGVMKTDGTPITTDTDCMFSYTYDDNSHLFNMNITNKTGDLHYNAMRFIHTQLEAWGSTQYDCPYRGENSEFSYTFGYNNLGFTAVNTKLSEADQSFSCNMVSTSCTFLIYNFTSDTNVKLLQVITVSIDGN